MGKCCDIAVACGLMSSVVSNACAGQFSRVQSFNGNNGSLSNPSSFASSSATPGSITFGAGGVIYATTSSGGPYNKGVVFSLTTTGSQGAATEKVIYGFGGTYDGAAPSGGIAQDKSGALYGFTSNGGTSARGVAYRLQPPTGGAGGWTEAVLANFGANNSVIGLFPVGRPLLIGGNVVGVTGQGYTGSPPSIFTLSPPSSGTGPWTQSVLYSFTQSEVNSYGDPTGYLVADGTGKLFGTTSGSVFTLAPPTSGSGAWTKTNIFIPSGQIRGPVAVSSAGKVYGTYLGGSWGEFFQLSPPTKAGGTWTEIETGAPFSAVYGGASGGAVLGNGDQLYTFSGSGGFKNGQPQSLCVNNGCGVLFSITPPASSSGSWSYEAVHYFTGGFDGATPQGELSLDTSGAIYGTTSNGGLPGDKSYGFSVYGWGTVFKYVP